MATRHDPTGQGRHREANLECNMGAAAISAKRGQVLNCHIENSMTVHLIDKPGFPVPAPRGSEDVAGLMPEHFCESRIASRANFVHCHRNTAGQ